MSEFDRGRESAFREALTLLLTNRPAPWSTSATAHAEAALVGHLVECIENKLLEMGLEEFRKHHNFNYGVTR